MPKKTNAFLLFSIDYKDRQRKLGRQISLSEATTEAGDIWRSMSDRDKSVYQKKAKQENLNPKESGKLTSQGVPITIIEKEKREKDNEERLMKKEVEEIVKINFLDNTLPGQKFYFIMVNYFCKDIRGDIYLPAEIALSEYSLKDGITKKYHQLINPGIPMFGLAYEAKNYSEKTHKLPPPPDALGIDNLSLIYSKILEFVVTDATNAIVFTHKDHIKSVKGVLEYVKGHSKDEDLSDIKVYPMQYLFFVLKKATSEIGENKVPHSIHITDSILERDQHEYARDISCKFHEDSDNGKYCALSCVTRWAYMFSEYMCNDLAIEMKPGKHMPVDTIQAESQSIDTTAYAFDESNKSLKTEKVNDHHSASNPWKKQSDTVSYTEENFPALDAKKNRPSTSNMNKDFQYADFEDSEKASRLRYNPWAIRSEVAKPPSQKSSFDFANVVAGRGRGIMRQEENNSKKTTSRNSSMREYYFFDEQ